MAEIAAFFTRDRGTNRFGNYSRFRVLATEATPHAVATAAAIGDPRDEAGSHLDVTSVSRARRIRCAVFAGRQQ
jgi:hypothetical protein